MTEPKEPLDFNELFQKYIDEGYSAEEAENMAWKMIQGNPANWESSSTISEYTWELGFGYFDANYGD